MLKNSSFARPRVAILAALLGVCSPFLPLYAQENPTTTAPLTDAKQLQELAPGATAQLIIPVRNVKPSLIAYWLDPAHQQVPIDIKIAQAMGGEGSFQKFPRFPGNAYGPAGLKLPDGITRIVPIDPQNSILAFGTKEGLQALSDAIPPIDVLLTQYEIEAQFLQLSRADLKELKLDFGDITKNDPSFVGAVTGVQNIQADVARLIAEGKLKVVTAPRVTAIDGLTAQLQQSTYTPFIIDQEVFKQAKEGQNEQAAGHEMQQGLAYVTTTIGLKATPHRGKNDFVSLSLTPTLGTRTVSVTATVRNGQSFAIQLSPPNEEKQLIVLVTNRRLARVGDR